jgi:polyisoprenoid-binding protein YceI
MSALNFAKLLLRSALLLCALAGEHEASRAATYSLDSSKADVTFTYYAGPTSWSGRFTQMEGSLDFDERAPERGTMTAVVQTNSVTASAWEWELRSSMFFDVENFPELRFISRSAKPAGTNAVDFMGDLVMKGVAKPVTLHLVFEPTTSGQPPKAAPGNPIKVTAHIKRSDFGMTALSLIVDDDIDIEINGTLRKK